MPTADLQREVESVPWYHTIDLPDNVTTPGRWDTRQVARRLPIPRSLAGMRCLDIGTWDGFWAFEMERRGASEVIAIDVHDVSLWDWPPNTPPERLASWDAGVGGYPGFALAHEALGSTVKRIEASVYDLDHDGLGSFDFVFMGSLLPHLRDPVRALAAVRRVAAGSFLSADTFSVSLTLRRPYRPAADLHGDATPFWWTPNLACRKRWMRSAGFEHIRVGRPYLNKRGRGAPPADRSFRSWFMEWLGLPHVAILASNGIRRHNSGVGHPSR